MKILLAIVLIFNLLSCDYQENYEDSNNNIEEDSEMAFLPKPDEVPEFAKNDIVDPSTGQNNVAEPPTSKKNAGWAWQEKPARNWMNWLHRKTYQWIDYFNQYYNASNELKINVINEFDTASGVNVDGVLLKDSQVNTDTVNEKTGDTGVTIDGTTIKDSVLTDDGSAGIGIEETNGSIVRSKIVSIGDWNMDSAADLSVAHGLTDRTVIKRVSAIIRHDNDTPYYELQGDNYGTILFTDTNIQLGRVAGGNFDNTNFNATSFNRGWIFIDYID
jgi:hypothetical protein